jgi:hypothetical protein
MRSLEIIFLIIILLIILAIWGAVLSVRYEAKLTSGESFLGGLLNVIIIILIFIFGYLIIIGRRIKKYLSSKKLETPNRPYLQTQVSSQKRICPRCKAECGIEDNFCMQCSEKLIKN